MPRAYGRLLFLQDGNSEGFFTASNRRDAAPANSTAFVWVVWKGGPSAYPLILNDRASYTGILAIARLEPHVTVEAGVSIGNIYNYYKGKEEI
jgi:hypothetical protein